MAKMNFTTSKESRKERELTKSHVKTMRKNSNSHHIRNTGRVLKYGASSFGRNIWLSLAAILVMTITLIILGFTAFASVILSNTADSMREKIDITIFLKPETSEEVLTNLESIIKKDENVKSTEISTSEQEYARFLKENDANEELKSALNDEEMRSLMLASMQAVLRIKVYDVDNLDSIKDVVENNEQFVAYRDPDNPPTYTSDQSKIETISSWANIAKTGGLVLGAIFLVISALVIFNTIRMAIFARKEEIYMMKLVGANNSFIRGPFLVEASMCGLISGILASSALVATYYGLGHYLTDYGIDMTNIANIMETNQLLLVYLALSAIGILVGLISSRLAIRKYLH